MASVGVAGDDVSSIAGVVRVSILYDKTDEKMRVVEMSGRLEPSRTAPLQGPVLKNGLGRELAGLPQ